MLADPERRKGTRCFLPFHDPSFDLSGRSRQFVDIKAITTFLCLVKQKEATVKRHLSATSINRTSIFSDPIRLSLCAFVVLLSFGLLYTFGFFPPYLFDATVCFVLHYFAPRLIPHRKVFCRYTYTTLRNALYRNQINKTF